MISYDLKKLNPLEQKIHASITELIANNPEITITEAAFHYGCSPSKISKYIKKLGFPGYKQYRNFVSGTAQAQNNPFDEIGRLQNFLNSFDIAIADHFIDLILKSPKILLFGYGPSYYAAQYLQIRLSWNLNCNAVSLMESDAVDLMADGNTLVIILTTSGRFASFQELLEKVHMKGARSLILIEERNTDLVFEHSEVIYFTNTRQNSSSIPYYKSRAIFFLLTEIVTQRYLERISDDFIS